VEDRHKGQARLLMELTAVPDTLLDDVTVLVGELEFL
jgi:hypothetical protein